MVDTPPDIIPYDYANYKKYTKALADVLAKRLQQRGGKSRAADTITKELSLFTSAVSQHVTGKGDHGEKARQQMRNLVAGAIPGFSFSNPNFHYDNVYNPLNGQVTLEQFYTPRNTDVMFLAMQIASERWGHESAQAKLFRDLLYMNFQ